MCAAIGAAADAELAVNAEATWEVLGVMFFASSCAMSCLLPIGRPCCAHCRCSWHRLKVIRTRSAVDGFLFPSFLAQLLAQLLSRYTGSGVLLLSRCDGLTPLPSVPGVETQWTCGELASADVGRPSGVEGLYLGSGVLLRRRRRTFLPVLMSRTGRDGERTFGDADAGPLPMQRFCGV